MAIRHGFQGHVGAEIKAEATEANVLGFMPTEEAHFSNAQLPQDLGAHAEIAVTHGLGLDGTFVGHARRVGMAPEVDQGTATLLGQHTHGLLEEARFEAVQVVGKGLHMHADQGRLSAGTPTRQAWQTRARPSPRP